jgi:His/Glu/Gln/Arg/opine family amino acid ABC transporter permease subunit
VHWDTQIFLDALKSSALINGALITIALTGASWCGAQIIGAALAVGRTSRFRPVRVLVLGYLWFFRAVPLLLQLLFVWNALPQLIPSLKSGWFTPFIAAFVALSLHEAAYMAEITRSGLMSVDPGQRDAARSLGMSTPQSYRHVIVPQAVRVMIPPSANEFITLLKLTSLASVISLSELLTVTQQDVAVNFRFAELYAAATVYYLVMVSLLMVGQSYLERRFRWRSRAAAAPTAPQGQTNLESLEFAHDAR